MITLEVASEDLKSAYPARPFPVRHALSGHPLLTLPALAELARSLPGDRVEFNGGDCRPDQRPEDVRSVDMAPAQIVERIETANAWLVLKRVEMDPRYRALAEAALLDLARQRGFATLAQAGFLDVQAFVFVSSANAVTPFHVDHEENVFVQIHGDKRFHVYDNEDRALVCEEELEISPAKHRNLRYTPDYEVRARTFVMSGGDGCFVPYAWPHWVQTGGAFSISMAITWKSPRVLRLNKLRAANAILRDRGFPQAAPGTRPVADAVKVAAYTAARSLVEPLRRSERLRRALRGAFFGAKANYYYRQGKA
ncbi:cupin-like domain-containing protein [Salinarimonas soli]|uniref:Transcriptional regulator n=1 Tax=Salinarimonas soli TaxID=1638099 RepID=A0A5B2VZR8_9HYPH|nr:cupin-like domain-containing protein [Salinarimonas soli]KAA2244324.1 transcriptional regulator [Salinarimonas soli]